MNVVAQHNLPSGISCAKLSLRGSKELVAYGSHDGNIYVTSFREKGTKVTLSGLPSPVTSVAVTEQNILLGGSDNGSIQAWDISTGHSIHTFEKLHTSAVTAMDIRPRGPYFATVSSDNNLRIWDLQRKMCIQKYKDAAAPLCCVKFSINGKWVVTGCIRGIVRLYALATATTEGNFQFEKSPITALEFHPELPYLVVGSSSGAFALCNALTLDVVHRSSTLKDPVDSIICCGKNVCILAKKKLVVINLDEMQSDASVHSTSWESFTDVGFSSRSHEIYTVRFEGTKGIAGLVSLIPFLKKESASSLVKGDIVYQAVETSPLAITEIMDDDEEIALVLKARLAYIREVRELWYQDQVSALVRINCITEKEKDPSVLIDFLSVMQQQRMKEKITLEAVPYLLQLVQYVLNEDVDSKFTLLGLRTVRSMNTKFRARVEEGMRRARSGQSNGNNDPLGVNNAESALNALRQCTSSVMNLVTRGDNIGNEARQLMQELPP